MRNFLILVAAVAVLSSCANRKLQNAVSYEFHSLSMHKTGCYGTCPVYDLKLRSTGEVSLNAQYNLPFEGEHFGRLSKTDLATLLQMADSVNWSALEQDYLSGYSDLPATELSYSVDTLVYNLRFEYGYGPKHVEALSRALEQVVDTTQWFPLYSD